MVSLAVRLAAAWLLLLLVVVEGWSGAPQARETLDEALPSCDGDAGLEAELAMEYAELLADSVRRGGGVAGTERY